MYPTIDGLRLVAVAPAGACAPPPPARESATIKSAASRSGIVTAASAVAEPGASCAAAVRGCNSSIKLTTIGFIQTSLWSGSVTAWPTCLSGLRKLLPEKSL